MLEEEKEGANKHEDETKEGDEAKIEEVVVIDLFCDLEEEKNEMEVEVKSDENLQQGDRHDEVEDDIYVHKLSNSFTTYVYNQIKSTKNNRQK